MRKNEHVLLKWVERQVAACRPLALRYFKSTSLRVQRKLDDSPVTDADRAIEEKLRKAFAKALPGERIVGEEFGAGDGDADSYWTIDPIDGTRGFARGLPPWGILIGKVERGVPVLAVVDYPAVGISLGVAPGVAAYERIGTTVRRFAKAPKPPALRDTVIFHGGARWWQGTDFEKGFARLVTACFLERAYGDCYGYLWLLRGCADAVIEYGVKPWDVVPFAALAQATGRVQSDFSAKPHSIGPQTVTAHPSLAVQVGRILRGIETPKIVGTAT